MAFELLKAKLEAKKARREAILVMDKYINTLSTSAADCKDVALRKEIIDEIGKWVSLKEVYKKNTELPKWAQELITTSLKLLTLAGSVVACEIVTNRGTGDKLIIDGFKRLPGI